MAFSKARVADANWKYIEKLDNKEQREQLKWQLQAREPIHSFSDMKVGDHFVKKKSVFGRVLYYHHFLCIGSEGEGRPTIIHYSNTVANALHRFFKTGSCGSGSALGQLAIIQEVTLPHKDFIESESELQAERAEVERVVWPEELQRYSTNEVVDRARKRKDEKYYNVAENNCESFVMWCLCSLNISLQATRRVLSVTVFFGSLATTVFHALSQIPKGIAECVEKVVFGRSVFGNVISAEKGIEGLSALGSTLGIGITLLWEICCAAYDIYEAKQKWNKGVHITSRKEFIKEVVESVLFAASRSGCSIGGMFLGQLFLPIPILGALVGLLAGTLVGHVVGVMSSKFFSEHLAKVVDKLIEEESK